MSGIKALNFDKCLKNDRTICITGNMQFEERNALNGITIAASNYKISDHKIATSSSGMMAVFDIVIILHNDVFPDDLTMIFTFASGDEIAIPWVFFKDPGVNSGFLAKEFSTIIDRQEVKTLLDIGGRARSGFLRAQQFSHLEVEVVDILPGTGVTTVCDAHELSLVLPARKFDAVLSFAVFEHLIMPWKVVIEINRVMKTGAVGFVGTNQTVGMHDRPWDYFRFSDTAWKGLFNIHTGFEIIKTELFHPYSILPIFWNEADLDAERVRGFRASHVLFRKISETTLDWPLNARDVTDDTYPA